MSGGIAGHWVFYSAGHTRGGIKSSQNKATFCDIVPGLPADCGGFVGSVIALVLWVGDFGGCGVPVVLWGGEFCDCDGFVGLVIVGVWVILGVVLVLRGVVVF
jgi:hypothetical protein